VVCFQFPVCTPPTALSSSKPAFNVASVSVLPVIFMAKLNQRPKPPPLANDPTTRQRFGVRAALCRSTKAMAY